MNGNILSKIIDDFIFEFTHVPENKSIESILVSVSKIENGELEVIVEDCPLEIILYDIRKNKNEETSNKIGLYKNIPVELFINNGTNLSIGTIIKYDTTLVEKAFTPVRYFDDQGKELNLSIEEGLLEYEPFLEIKYNLKKEVKIINLWNGNEISKQFDIK